MTITKNSLIMMIFFLTIKHCLAQSAHSSQLTAHSSQLTAHSSQSLILIKIIFYFTIQNLLLKRAVSEFFRLLFFYVYLAVCHAEFISAYRFRNKFAMTESGCIRN